MPFDHQATTDLEWGNALNRVDFANAGPGQWFLGVLDTSTHKVYLIPSDLQPPDAVQREIDNHRLDPALDSIYVSRPQPRIPQWQSIPMKGQLVHGINSPAANDSGGLRQHGRVTKSYGLAEADCLGFAVIKLTNDLAEFRDRSNSLNQFAEKHAGAAIRMSPSARSARMPENWSNAVRTWLDASLPIERLQDTIMP